MGGDGPGEPGDRRRGRARAPRLSRLPGTGDATGLERAGRDALGPDRTRRTRPRCPGAHHAPTSHHCGRLPRLALSPLHRDHQRPGRPRPGDPLLPVLAGGHAAAHTASPALAWTGNSTGPHPGSTWSKSPAPGPCWKPPKPPPATTSSSPPPGSTAPTCSRSDERCRPSARRDRLRPRNRVLRNRTTRATTNGKAIASSGPGDQTSTASPVTSS